MEDGNEISPGASLGRRVRDFSEFNGWSLRNVTERTGLSIGLNSFIERGLASLSFRSLRLLAGALEVPMERFSEAQQTSPKNTPSRALKREQRHSLRFSHQGMSIQIASFPEAKNLQPFIVELEPGAGSGGEMDNHEGDEAGNVLSEKIEFWLDQDHLVLTEGNLFQFWPKHGTVTIIPVLFRPTSYG